MRKMHAQMVIAAAAVLVSLILAVAGVAMFQSSDPRAGSVWKLVVSDRLTLGFVRVAVIAAAIYVIASFPALILAGRWIRSVGPAGVTTDELTHVEGNVDRALALVLEVADEPPD